MDTKNFSKVKQGFSKMKSSSAVGIMEKAEKYEEIFKDEVDCSKITTNEIEVLWK